MKAIVLLVLSSLLLIPMGCSSAEKSPTFEQISQDKAYEIMKSSTPHIVLDVRTPEEFADGHIDGAILIPDYEIEASAKNILTDKNALILVYCRSGRRSKLASQTLTNMGYTNIKEFGGIITWQYETEK
ncbi:MAG: rhodanese-like domain-containing protein [Oscillospiraceae bacterium]|nr:rhodanese-like domain-containing protein [Oscillospiraceae bacterium]